MPKPLLVILGATASGKTKLAVAVANELNGQLISADSRQVFEGMTIGTGKDLNEYIIGEKQIVHHLIDIKPAGDHYNVNEFKEDFYLAFDQIAGLQQFPILCGGTGMYIHSILQHHALTAVPVNQTLRENLILLSKEELASRLNSYPLELRNHADHSSFKRMIRAIEIADYLSTNELPQKVRTEIDPLVVGLRAHVESRRGRILERLATRLQNGLIEEVSDLLAQGVSAEMLSFYGLEYKFVVAYLTNKIDLETLKEKLGIAICQFAKRQMTFFRKMEKDGVKINWLDADQDFSILKESTIQLVNGKFGSK